MSVSFLGAASQAVDRVPRKSNMICGVHGSPAYSETRPTWSKRKPAGIALACGSGFFVWAQPAIPARVAPAKNEYNKNFFIPEKSNRSRTASENPLFTLLRVNAMQQAMLSILVHVRQITVDLTLVVEHGDFTREVG
jgi:hypothetical protein